MAQKEWLVYANAGAPPLLGVAAVLTPWWVTTATLGPRNVQHFLFDVNVPGRSELTVAFGVALVAALLGFCMSALANRSARGQAVWAGAALGLGVAAAADAAIRWPPWDRFDAFLLTADRMTSIAGAPHLEHVTATPGIGWFLAIAACFLPALQLWRAAALGRR